MEGIRDDEEGFRDGSHAEDRWQFVRRERVLGRGGFGTVYEGIHKTTGEMVALKEITVTATHVHLFGCCWISFCVVGCD